MPSFTSSHPARGRVEKGRTLITVSCVGLALLALKSFLCRVCEPKINIGFRENIKPDLLTANSFQAGGIGPTLEYPIVAPLVVESFTLSLIRNLSWVDGIERLRPPDRVSISFFGQSTDIAQTTLAPLGHKLIRQQR